MKERLVQLKEVAFEVINDEQLPIPYKIHFRQSLGGVKGASATCRHIRNTTSYSILLNTTRAKFFEDPNGRYRNKQNGKRFKRALLGEEIKFPKMVANMAHEIAHLKDWNHTPTHKSYTDYLKTIIISKLTARGVVVDS